MKFNIKIKSFIILILIIYLNINSHSSPILLRGIVEGFYGIPWNYNIRADLLNFCREYNLNSYIYAPKDDPYHRSKWREPYPEEKIIELKNLSDFSSFCFCSLLVSLFFVFSLLSNSDIKYLINK